MNPPTGGSQALNQAPPWIMRAGDWLVLTKFPINLSTAMTCLAGYYLCLGTLDAKGLLTTAAVALMGAGACALNQWQEMDRDAWMERTCRRPLPAGRIRPVTALFVSGMLLGAGWGALAIGVGSGPAILGALAAGWYNLIYTPLKRHSSNAVCWGSPIGALPPMIGWVAAGGEILAPPILVLAAFFLLWQIPHFRVLQISAGSDYRRAGFPCPDPAATTGPGTARSLRSMVLLTVALGAVTPSVFLPIPSAPVMAIHLILSLAFGAVILNRIRNNLEPRRLRQAFGVINLHALAVVLFLCLTR